MKGSVLLVLIFVMLSGGCEEESITPPTCENGVIATVRDLTGLDGCGYVFELTDGTRLEPYRIGYCGTSPLPKEVTENPLYNFVFEEGKVVRITYEEIPDVASICMVGEIVKITCLEELGKLPECITAIKDEIQPLEIWRYTYNGKLVFVVTPDCCDQYVSVYDQNCNFICAPSGGISGTGDGKCTDFDSKATDGVLIWKSNR